MHLSRNKKHIVGLLVFILFVVATKSSWIKNPTAVLGQNEPGLYTVSNFVDGDTIIVDMAGRSETVRFIGIDTPETHRPNTPVQCYGPEASAFTKSFIGTNQVRLQADPLDTNRDRYGRLLRYVYLPDGTLVQDKLLSGGYAFAYTQFPFQKKQQFVAEQEQAKQSKLGLWGSCQVNVETNGRQQTNNL